MAAVRAGPAVLVAVLVGLAAACAADDTAEPVDSRQCTPLLYEGEGAPDVIIVSHMPRRGEHAPVTAQLVAAIRKVASGGAFISAEVAERLEQEAMPHAEGPRHATLSDREYQVFRLLVSGRSVSDIALELHLSAKTVSTHKARLMEKLGVDNNADLVRYAVRHRLIDDPNRS